ncbi:MAG: hypothetical protein ACREJD_09455 [Phycisphaerales bacterium]
MPFPKKKRPTPAAQDALPMLRQEIRVVKRKIRERYALFENLLETIEALYAEVQATRRFHDADAATPLLHKRVQKFRNINEDRGW